MDIGIIIYSQTGNTLSVCERLKDKLNADGHKAVIDKIEISGDPAKGSAEVSIKHAPDPSGYEAVVFASPVQAFSLAMPMTKYMKNITGLSGKKTVCFVTKQLPLKWTGGNHALSQMSKFCSKAGSEPSGKDMVIWSGKQREADIEAAVDRISSLF